MIKLQAYNSERIYWAVEQVQRVGWSNTPAAINLTDSIVLCDKCYKEFMTLFGNFKGAK